MIYKIVLSDTEFSDNDNETEIIQLYSFDTLHYIAIYEEDWSGLPDSSVNAEKRKKNKSDFYFFGNSFPNNFFDKHPYYVVSFIVDKFDNEYMPQLKSLPNDSLSFYSLNDYGHVVFSRGNNLESLCKRVAKFISKQIQENNIIRAYSIIAVDTSNINTPFITKKPIHLNFELENNYNIASTLSNIFESKPYSTYHFGQIDKTFELKKLRKEELEKLFCHINELPTFKIDYKISSNKFMDFSFKKRNIDEISKITSSINNTLEKLDNKIYFNTLSRYVINTLKKNEINSNYLCIVNAYFHVYNFYKDENNEDSSLNIMYYTKPLYEAFINNNQSLLRNNFSNFPKSSYIPTKIILFYTIIGELVTDILLNYNIEMSEDNAPLTDLEESAIRPYKSFYHSISQSEISSFFITANDLPTQLITWPNKRSRKKIHANYMYYNLSLSNWKKIRGNIFLIVHELSHNVGQIYRLREIRYGLIKELIIELSTINLYRICFPIPQQSKFAVSDYNDFFEELSSIWKESLTNFIEESQHEYFNQSDLGNENTFLLSNSLFYITDCVKKFSQLFSYKLKEKINNFKNEHSLYLDFFNYLNPEMLSYSFSLIENMKHDITYLFHECFADFIAFILVEISLEDYIHFYSKINKIEMEPDADKSLDFYRASIICIAIIKIKKIDIKIEKTKLRYTIDRIFFDKVIELKEEIDRTNFNKPSLFSIHSIDKYYYFNILKKVIEYLIEVSRNFNFYLSKNNEELLLLKNIYKASLAEEAITLLFKNAPSLSFVYKKYHDSF
ncbi:hypothetical protein [uncultured Dubosiella sp.]|uniref:hypothetical protein n=1 Tax=uncultured Dubosiella sp. TaxID=1937011 RepID=UPI0025B43E0D|nr:hypothetical protein [uncultured Dubosiella sp.]